MSAASSQAAALRQTGQVMRSPSADAYRELRERMDELEKDLKLVWETLMPTDDEEAYKLGLSRSQAVLFKLLRGRSIVSKETLHQAIENANNSVSQIKNLDAAIYQLRKKLGGTKYNIKNHWGVGYSLEVSK